MVNNGSLVFILVYHRGRKNIDLATRADSQGEY